MILDGAKTVTEADAEVSEAVDFARYYARTLRETAGELADCRMEPLGVVVVTPPWNFPLSIPAGGRARRAGGRERRHPQAGARGGARRLVAGPLSVGCRRPA